MTGALAIPDPRKTPPQPGWAAQIEPYIEQADDEHLDSIEAQLAAHIAAAEKLDVDCTELEKARRIVDVRKAGNRDFQPQTKSESVTLNNRRKLLDHWDWLRPKVLAATKRDAVTRRAVLREVTRYERNRRYGGERLADADRGLYACSVADLPDHVETASVDVVITDPPYPYEFLDTYRDLAHTAAKLLKPGGLLLAMAGQSYLPDVIARLSDSPLTYHWTVAYLTPGGKSVQLWRRKVNTFWKPVLVYANGAYDGTWTSDKVTSDPNANDKHHHEWGQSESGMAALIRRFSEPGDLICDPFLGGGTTALVAASLGRYITGCDIDAEKVATTKRRLS